MKTKSTAIQIVKHMHQIHRRPETPGAFRQETTDFGRTRRSIQALRAYAIGACSILMSSSAQAAYPGQELLEFSRSYIIAPLGLFAIVIAIGASFFRPELVRHALYGAALCAILFFIIKMAPQLMTAFGQ